jgi:hypothetical protein
MQSIEEKNTKVNNLIKTSVKILAFRMKNDKKVFDKA